MSLCRRTVSKLVALATPARSAVRASFAPMAVSAPAAVPAPSAWSRFFSADAGACDMDAATAIRTRLTAELSPLALEVEDTSGGCGAFFRLVVVSDKFEGKSSLARHRLVQGVLKENIKGMHGLTINALTPQQFEEIKAAQKK